MKNTIGQVAAYRPNQGERNPNSFLEAHDVRRIRKLLERGVGGAKIADEYGITRSCVSLIRTRKAWKHIQ